MAIKILTQIMLAGFLIYAQIDEPAKIKGFASGPLSSFSNKDEVVNLYGQPISLSFKSVKNPHDSSVYDTLISFRYDSLSADFLWVSKKRVGYMNFIEVTGHTYPLIAGIELGMTKSVIISTIGIPNHSGDGFIEYNDDSYSFVRLHFIESKLTRIKWTNAGD